MKLPQFGKCSRDQGNHQRAGDNFCAMVVNFCLPHFETSVHCNKLSADGYDVSNLLSGDPSLRRRGFKLEYFLRPPVQVTLRFPVQVEVCRVDVELWPPGMDLGQSSRGVEIHTSTTATQEEGGQFLLVGCCQVKDQVSVIFSGPRPRPRPPFPPAPPEAPTGALWVELWSRGAGSLGAVTQLRVNLPYGGAGSSLGLRALAVWGRPSHCCPPDGVERIARAHTDSLRPSQIESRSTTHSSKSPPSSDSAKVNTLGDIPIPEEFLDPLTQEVMSLPMLLPSGAVIDFSTLEKYQRQEATWGRPPNDPFTGVPFSGAAQPLPCPQLKGRIDLFLLRGGDGATGGDSAGRVGRAVQQEQPRPSRLTGCSSSLPEATSDPTPSLLPSPSDILGQDGGRDPAEGQRKLCAPDPRVSSESQMAEAPHSRKRVLEVAGISGASSALLPSDSSPALKRLRNDAPTQHNSSSESSHEQRLADSLDQALSSALRNLPAFTSHKGSQSCAAETNGEGATAGDRMCAQCTCPLSQYPSCPPNIPSALWAPALPPLSVPQRPPQTVPTPPALPCLPYPSQAQHHHTFVKVKLSPANVSVKLYLGDVSELNCTVQ
ncbi:hypothetical protein GJAV_G00026420 [Gymnothorax javanicus]|nr:hypothetical protein GJAV_G00026420 [Gymnothorax javanicus]